MKEPKFRVWDGKLMHTVSDLVWTVGGMKWYGPGAGMGWCYLSDYWKKKKITLPDSADILMQWTGLKDKNNVDIYEGDIVQVYMGEIVGEDWKKYTVEYGGYYKTCSFGLSGPPNRYTKNKPTWDELTHQWKSEHLKVIGNIYEGED